MIPHQIKIFILLCLLFNFSFSGAYNFKNGELSGVNPSRYEMKGRKLIKVEAMLDYTDPGANPIHEPPHRGSGGGRGGNP